jgi:hypothetical protein
MRYWIGAVSKEHVEIGVREGIAQLGHGKRAPLARLKKDDWFVYYSPVIHFGDKTPLQAFTALGQVTDEAIYQHQMSDDFMLYRRKMRYMKVHDAPIRPLLDTLQCTVGKKSWGYIFRYGLVEISEEDFRCIERAMIS